MAKARISITGLAAVLAVVFALSVVGSGTAYAVAQKEIKPQTTCPVMGGRINKNLFVDADGYRIYVCCPGCIAKVKADPAKYLKVLADRGESPEKLATAAGTAKPADQPCGAGGSCVVDLKQKGAHHRQAAEAKDVATVSTQTLLTLINSGVPLTILDARGDKAFAAGHIPGAKVLGIKATAEQAAAAIASKDALAVTYCAGEKCPMSHHLAAALRGLGYKNVLVYTAGIAGWTAAGQKVETAATK